MESDHGDFNLRGKEKSMVTVNKSDISDELNFKGKSTDTKPEETFAGMKIVNGSTFFEMDTQEIYYYDGATDKWLDQPT